MAMDVSFQDQGAGFTTGATHVEGVSMNAVPKPVALEQPSSQPAQPKPSQPATQPGGGTQPQPSGGAPAPWPSTPEDAQRMIDRLMSNAQFKADYASGKLSAEQRQGLTRLFETANPEPGQEAERSAQEIVQELVEDLPDLERFAGVHMPDVGPGLRAFDTGDYAQFVNYVIAQDIPAVTAQNLMEEYATRLIASGGRGLTSADFSDLRGSYAGRLSPQVMDTLEKWLTTEVYSRMKALQGGR